MHLLIPQVRLKYFLWWLKLIALSVSFSLWVDRKSSCKAECSLPYMYKYSTSAMTLATWHQKWLLLDDAGILLVLIHDLKSSLSHHAIGSYIFNSKNVHYSGLYLYFALECVNFISQQCSLWFNVVTVINELILILLWPWFRSQCRLVVYIHLKK